MRFVIYDDESLEPITVISLPFTDRDMDQRMRERGQRWRVPVPADMYAGAVAFHDPEPECVPIRVVELEFERFIRNSPRHGEQLS